jgi:hypothetical protein
VTSAFDRKQDLLAAELQRYFDDTCPALVARWQATIRGLAPPFLRELVSRLEELETVTNETNRQLEAAFRTTVDEGTPSEAPLDRALASLENLNEIATAIMRRLDELVTAAQLGCRAIG